MAMKCATSPAPARPRRALRGLATLGLLGFLAGCGGSGGGLTLGASSGVDEDQRRNALGVLVRGLASAVAPGEQAAPTGFTATRASLAAIGFDQPLLTAEIRDPDGTVRKAGLLQVGATNGTLLWQGGDGGGVTTREGVVVGTAGLLENAYSIEARPTLAALEAGGAEAYRKDWRHISGLNQIRRTQMSCTLTAEAEVEITVLRRAHRTTRLRETCEALTPDPLGGFLRIENLYWKGISDGVLWRTEQWISPKVGQIRLERVFL